MSEEAYIRALLRRSPRSQFRQNTAFVLDMFDIMRRHKANTSVRVHLSHNAESMRTIEGMSQEQILECLNGYAAISQNPTQRGAILQSMGREARTLFNAVKVVVGNVIGTPQSVSKVRAQSETASVFFGHQTAMITYSMSDYNSSLCLRACGENIEYDDQSHALNLPTEYKARWRRITSNPIAAAHFAEVCMEQLCRVLLGFPHDESKQRDGEGIFGTIYYYEFKPETNQRHWPNYYGIALQAGAGRRFLSNGLFRAS